MPTTSQLTTVLTMFHNNKASPACTIHTRLLEPWYTIFLKNMDTINYMYHYITYDLRDLRFTMVPTFHLQFIIDTIV